nr:hypothetical protein [uncultured Desulfobacter sp.]
MKFIFVLLLAIVFPACFSAQTYKCVAPDGSVHETKYPCDPDRVERFVSRFVELYPDASQQGMSRDDIKGLYFMAMGCCDEPFIKMTPEEIGKNSEPFFPWQMTAAMAQAAHEIICPQPKR